MCRRGARRAQLIREVTEEPSYDSYTIAQKLGKEFTHLKQSPHQVSVISHQSSVISHQ